MLLLYFLYTIFSIFLPGCRPIESRDIISSSESTLSSQKKYSIDPGSSAANQGYHFGSIFSNSEIQSSKADSTSIVQEDTPVQLAYTHHPTLRPTPSPVQSHSFAPTLFCSVTTLAGTPGISGYLDSSSPLDAAFNSPYGVTIDVLGNFYVTDYGNNVIRLISSSGTVSTLTGNIANAGFIDGVGLDAAFNGPSGITMTRSGSGEYLVVADSFSNAIRVVTLLGAVTTMAGDGTENYSDGIGTLAQFYAPTGVVVDGSGTIYVADSGNRVIRKITPSGEVSTVAGSPEAMGSADGLGSSSSFSSLSGITIDSAGTIFVTDAVSNTVRAVSPSAGYLVTTIAGDSAYIYGIYGFPSAVTDGQGSNALFNIPTGIVASDTGDLYVGDSGDNIIRKITPGGLVMTYAGSYNLTGGYEDAPTMSARFNNPTGVLYVSGADGYVVVVDTANHVIRQICGPTPVPVTPVPSVSPVQPPPDPTSVVTLAGAAGVSGYLDSIIGSDARFSSPYGAVADSSGNVYVSDYGNNAIRKISSSGSVTTLVGASILDGPRGIALGRNGSIEYLVVADSKNDVIRMVTLSGVVSTIAGSLANDLSLPDSTIQLNHPSGVAVDSDGTVYVADSGNRVIRKISPNGAVSTIAGSPFTIGSVDGYGSSASFKSLTGLALDNGGVLYATDSASNSIRSIRVADGLVSTIAGNASASFQAANNWNTSASQPNSIVDGVRESALFYYPTGLAVTPNSFLYVADSGENTIRGVGPAGTVTTVAGKLSAGSADGLPSQSQFYHPSGVTYVSAGGGYLIVTDTLNHLVRKISFSRTPSQEPSPSPSTIPSLQPFQSSQPNLHVTGVSGGSSTPSTQATTAAQPCGVDESSGMFLNNPSGGSHVNTSASCKYNSSQYSQDLHVLCNCPKTLAKWRTGGPRFFNAMLTACREITECTLDTSLWVAETLLMCNCPGIMSRMASADYAEYLAVQVLCIALKSDSVQLFLPDGESWKPSAAPTKSASNLTSGAHSAASLITIAPGAGPYGGSATGANLLAADRPVGALLGRDSAVSDSFPAESSIHSPTTLTSTHSEGEDSSMVAAVTTVVSVVVSVTVAVIAVYSRRRLMQRTDRRRVVHPIEQFMETQRRKSGDKKLLL